MFDELPAKPDVTTYERAVGEFWVAREIFQKSLAQRRDAPTWVFYEGPPTANGKPHHGHVLTRVMKDLFPRYKTMCGFHVPRKAGWDTHGLPVEIEVEKELGLAGKPDIETYGVEALRSLANLRIRFEKERHTASRQNGNADRSRRDRSRA